ncbi:MAG: PIN domain-containing protein, partial [Nitrospirae bacterium]|nr:PIN domain-containing protein [Fimbriimonadaceae bacterium]
MKRQRGTGLETRHVFLDTQVYHSLKHNPANPAFKQLMSHVGERRLALHICDITLLEVKRQLHETVASRARELALVEKDLKRWRAAAPRVSLPGLVHLNVEPLSKALFDEFCGAVLVTCRATMHRALDIHAKEVFDTYFGRYPPFDREGSKEFPDGFVLKALEKWSEAETTKIYVVSADRAVARAAE